ncbi:MAG TPA: carboxypeptidase regulatory-like domain-containing protein, partial [Pyrinomonadaceae bacterium]|nr:carboxypeptidase regulatory-like domain-containing protein [Pyrinomonadaceae bacterium]
MDNTGAAVSGATVIVTDNQTGKERTVVTNSDGTYEVSQLEFGTYTVKITANGFKTYSATELKIDAGREYSLNAALEVGAVTEQVTVTAGSETINSTTAELSTTVSPQQIKELPLNGRNPLSLLNLQAGVNATSGSINGQRTSSVNYTRDGLNVQDNFIRNGFVSDQPTVDDTGEFTVVTQNANADQGQGGSTQVQLVTPRGGKDFHGALYAFNRNSKFTANSYLNNAGNIAKPFLNRNQFGGSISGPVPFPVFGEGTPYFNKDKTFFFFNYEGFRLANQVTITGLTTLLPAAQNGTFTYTGTDGVVRTVNVLTGAGFDLSTTARQNEFNNSGGVLSVDPIIQSRILSRLPATGNTTTFTGTNFLQGYSINRSNPEQRDAFTTRFDAELNDTNSFNFVFKRNNIKDARTDIAAGFLPTTTVDQGGPTNLFSGAYRIALGSNFSNEIRGGFQYA